MVSPIRSAKAASASPPLASPAAQARKAATDFYAAFARRDAAAMEAAYDPKVKFHDPLFGTLKGKRKVMEMWNTIMPAANPKTFSIEPKVLGAPVAKTDGSFEVKVHWDAHYDLGKRHVDNHSDTTLTIKNGKIVAQRDEWDLDTWTKQALPFGGGTRVGDDLARFAAHSFIELKDLFTR